jgi:predicted DNA-binding protein
MMQDEMSEKSINLAARIGRLTAEEIRRALEKITAGLKSETNTVNKNTDREKPVLIHGKQTLKQLSKQTGGLSTIELKDPNLRLLNREMKKHGIDFAVARDGGGKYTLFFKGKDADSMTHAFKRYSQNLIKPEVCKPSIEKTLADAKAMALAVNAGRGKVKNRIKGAREI